MTSGLDAAEEKTAKDYLQGRLLPRGGEAIRGRRPWRRKETPREYRKRMEKERRRKRKKRKRFCVKVENANGKKEGKSYWVST